MLLLSVLRLRLQFSDYLEYLPEKKLSLISYSQPFISIRSYQNDIIYLSNSHLINQKPKDTKHYQELLKKLEDIHLEPKYLWSNSDVMTVDGLPYIGALKKNFYIATGYNTWGLATGFYAGKMIQELITNNQTKYESLTNPRRKFPFLPQMQNACHSMTGFIKGWITPQEKTHICPHMGCKLLYNEMEDTWDCPCHGSRFARQGTCIQGPSNKNIED